MTRRDFVQRLTARWISFRSLSLVDQAVAVLVLAGIVLSLVQAGTDLEERWLSFVALSQGGNAGDFLKTNGIFLAGLVVTVALYFALGRNTDRSVLARFMAADPALSKTREIAMENLVRNAPRDGARIDRFGPFAGWTDPGVNAALVRAPDGLTIEPVSEPWLAYRDGLHGGSANGRLLQQYVVRRALAQGQHVFNNSKVRLEQSIGDRGELRPSIRVRRTDYLSSMMTDALAFQRVAERSANGVELTDGVSEFLGRNANGEFCLKSLGATASSNQLGVSVIGLTRDGFAVTVLQSERSHHSRNLLAPTGSGSLDWSDLGGETSLVAAARKGAVREMREEIGLDGASRAIATDAIVYAFTRLIHRGGKPEFFALGLIDARWDEICGLAVTRHEKIFSARRLKVQSAPIGSGPDLRQEVRDLCTGIVDRIVLAEDGSDALRRDHISYQLLHGAMLLREATEDAAGWRSIRQFLAPVSAEYHAA